MTQRSLPAFGVKTANLRQKLGRRGLLRGLMAAGGAVAIPLPLLDMMLNENGNAYAAGEAIPTRYITWFFGNGVLPGLWTPKLTTPDWALSAQLEPLKDFKSHLTVISGLTHNYTKVPHPDGSAAMMTGTGTANKTARTASIDQVIVKNTAAKNADFKSIELGVTPATPNGAETTLKALSHTGPNAALPPEFDPAKIFTRLFSDFKAPGTTVDPKEQALKDCKKSVLDAVGKDIAELQSSVGAKDKQRLEGHFDGIRSLETRLSNMATASAACVVPGKPTVARDSKSEAPPAVNTVMSELSAMALACNRTQVLTYVFSLPAAHVYYRHLATNMNDDFHDTICHTDAGNESTQTRVNTGVMYTMKCLAEFLGKLKGITEGDATLLDKSLVYVTSCTSWGKVHSPKDWPILFAGKAGGKLAGNVHYRQEGGHTSKALLTIAKIMGCGLNEFGMDEGKVTSELPSLIKA